MDFQEVDSCFERRREELLGYKVMLLLGGCYLTAEDPQPAAAAGGTAVAAAAVVGPQSQGSQSCLTDSTNFDYWLVTNGGPSPHPRRSSCLCCWPVCCPLRSSAVCG